MPLFFFQSIIIATFIHTFKKSEWHAHTAVLLCRSAQEHCWCWQLFLPGISSILNGTQLSGRSLYSICRRPAEGLFFYFHANKFPLHRRKSFPHTPMKGKSSGAGKLTKVVGSGPDIWSGRERMCEERGHQQTLRNHLQPDYCTFRKNNCFVFDKKVNKGRQNHCVRFLWHFSFSRRGGRNWFRLSYFWPVYPLSSLEAWHTSVNEVYIKDTALQHVCVCALQLLLYVWYTGTVLATIINERRIKALLSTIVRRLAEEKYPFFVFAKTYCFTRLIIIS